MQRHQQADGDDEGDGDRRLGEPAHHHPLEEQAEQRRGHAAATNEQGEPGRPALVDADLPVEEGHDHADGAVRDVEDVGRRVGEHQAAGGDRVGRPDDDPDDGEGEELVTGSLAGASARRLGAQARGLLGRWAARGLGRMRLRSVCVVTPLCRERFRAAASAFLLVRAVMNASAAKACAGSRSAKWPPSASASSSAVQVGAAGVEALLDAGRGGQRDHRAVGDEHLAADRVGGRAGEVGDQRGDVVDAQRVQRPRGRRRRRLPSSRCGPAGRWRWP